jgi:putative RNA 2'-phosphotransferase
MTKINLIKLSRFLSYVLRHKPDAIGLTMEKDGWVNVEELLLKMNGNGKVITLATLRTIVQQDDKQRYSFNEDQTRIRANQGHSIEVDLKLEPLEPPEYLYHGTTGRNLDSIQQKGLLKQQRHHVHLSENTETAKRVGARYGKPVILTIQAAAMAKAGHVFYRSENHVWLTDTVPPKFIKFPNN